MLHSCHQRAARTPLIKVTNEPTIDVAVKAYKTIIRDDIEDILRYNSYLQFFSYVKKPEESKAEKATGGGVCLYLQLERSLMPAIK